MAARSRATARRSTPTGFGYYAGPGYDLVTGLGTPNGVLLGRALTAIAHSQISFDSRPDVIDSDGHGGWTAAPTRACCFQTMSDHVTQVGGISARTAFGFFSNGLGELRLDEPDGRAVAAGRLRPALVVMFDKQAQGGLAQAHVSTGEALAVSIDFRLHSRDPGDLEQPVRLCRLSFGRRRGAGGPSGGGGRDGRRPQRPDRHRPTAPGRSGRSVDHLLSGRRPLGTINGLHPGDAGYQAAAQARAYR